MTTKLPVRVKGCGPGLFPSWRSPSSGRVDGHGGNFTGFARFEVRETFSRHDDAMKRSYLATIAARRLVPSVYPPALIACIRDGRCPVDSELKQIAGKTWEEGARFLDATTPAMTSRLVLRALSPQAGAQGLER
jgi:hypothetical protein